MLKLKDLLNEEEQNGISEEMLNEDSTQLVLMLAQMALAQTVLTMAISRGATTGGQRDTRSMGEKLKDFYEKYTKVKPLMNKLDKDPDVQKFVKDNIGGDHKGYHNLIKSKLSPDEMKFLTKIKFDELPSVKDPEKSAQMKADRQVKLKQQSQDYKAKQADKLKKMAGGLDLDTTKIKNSDTGNDISLRTALGYGKTHPVFQSAMARVKQSKSKGGKPSSSNIFK
jgi:hypothetical protein